RRAAPPLVRTTRRASPSSAGGAPPPRLAPSFEFCRRRKRSRHLLLFALFALEPRRPRERSSRRIERPPGDEVLLHDAPADPVLGDDALENRGGATSAARRARNPAARAPRASCHPDTKRDEASL